MQKVIILGSSGSIGRNAIRVIQALKGFTVVGIAVYRKHRLFARQITALKPRMACIIDNRHYKHLKRINTRTSICVGEQGIYEMIDRLNADVLICAFASAVGIHGIIRAIEKRMRICLATKELLVSFGDIVMKKIKHHKASIFPIDSEHSALFQCLGRHPSKSVKSLILTASGGPLFKRSLKNITIKDVLKHPVWQMGKKITVDSATLMNKGLEVIEAHHLFGIPPEKIKVTIHPEAICHSLVEFVDNSILAQLSIPDMRLPIQYALTAPDRRIACIPRLDVCNLNTLHFYPPNRKKFPCLKLAYDALSIGKSMPAVLNAANEECVELFLKGKLQFTHIPKTLHRTMNMHTPTSGTIEQYQNAEAWAKEKVRSLVC